MNLLLVEDDDELVRQLVAELGGEGYGISVEQSGRKGLEAALRKGWDLVILDVSLPELSGFEIVREMRLAKIETPVLFLSAKAEVHDRVQGLSLGGDDYLTKPFAMDELRARLQALSRRHASASPVPRRVPEGWELDPLLRAVTIRGNAVALQPREWSLLELFLEHEGEVLTNSFLLDQVWGIRFDPGTNVVNSAISRLRRKLDDPGRASHFETLRGRGHAFRIDV